MPSPTNGTWIEYTPDHNTTGGPRYPSIERTFSSEVGALRSAVKNGNAVTFLGHGRTLSEQLDADQNPQVDELDAPPEPKPRRTRKPKPVIDRDVAPDYHPEAGD